MLYEISLAGIVLLVTFVMLRVVIRSISDIEEVVEAMDSRLDEVEGAMDKDATIIATINRNTEVLRQVVEAVDKQQLRQKIKELEKENKKMRAELSETTSTLYEALHTIEELQLREEVLIDKYEDEINVLTEKLRRKTYCIEGLKRNLDRMREKCSDAAALLQVHIEAAEALTKTAKEGLESFDLVVRPKNINIEAAAATINKDEETTVAPEWAKENARRREARWAEYDRKQFKKKKWGILTRLFSIFFKIN